MSASARRSRYVCGMTGTRIDQLTEPQRACLRLVHSHHNSKEIAAIFGVSPSAIDKRIERAVQMLGVATRFEAARLLERHERPGDQATAPTASPASVEASERLPSEPFDVANRPPPQPIPVSFEPWGLVRRFLGVTGDGIEGAARNRLSKGDRIVRLIGMVGLIALTSMALVNMAMTVSTLMRQNRTRPAAELGVVHTMPAGGKIHMLKQRRQAADLVRVDFLRAELAVDEAARYAASCVSTLLQQRAEANLPVGTGLAALQLVADASADIIKARQKFVDAHRALVDVRHDIGLGAFAYGDDAGCPPEPEGLRREAPRLAAVA